MDPEAHLSELLSERIIRIDGKDEEITLESEFIEICEHNEDKLEKALDYDALLPETDIATSELLNINVLRSNSIFGGIYISLIQRGPQIDVKDIPTFTLILQQIHEKMPPSNGSPKSFLPINGNQINIICQLKNNSIVYVWLDDCEQCDVMKEEFEDFFPEPEDSLGLFSIYGPDWSKLLHEEYEVVGGPTTLFIKNNKIDARLYGAHPTVVIEKEIENVTE